MPQGMVFGYSVLGGHPETPLSPPSPGMLRRGEKHGGWCSSGREMRGSGPLQPPSAPLRTKAALSLRCLLARYKRALLSGSKSPSQACPPLLPWEGLLWRGPRQACPLLQLGQHVPSLLGFGGGGQCMQGGGSRSPVLPAWHRQGSWGSRDRENAVCRGGGGLSQPPS